MSTKYSDMSSFVSYQIFFDEANQLDLMPISSGFESIEMAVKEFLSNSFKAQKVEIKSYSNKKDQLKMNISVFFN